MPNPSSDFLFSGTEEEFAGVSNEKELAEKCPPEFRIKNDWSGFARHLFYRGSRKISDWKWRSPEAPERKKQLGLFWCILAGTMSHEDKMAVAGWMLSEMLEEVPPYLNQ